MLEAAIERKVISRLALVAIDRDHPFRDWREVAIGSDAHSVARVGRALQPLPPPNQGLYFQRLTGRLVRVVGILARWHMFEEKREAVMAIEAAVLPLIPKAKALEQFPISVNRGIP